MEPAGYVFYVGHGAFNVLRSTLKDCFDKEDVDAETLYHAFIPNGYLCLFLF
jgi:hypothetical protein